MRRVAFVADLGLCALAAALAWLLLFETPALRLSMWDVLIQMLGAAVLPFAALPYLWRGRGWGARLLAVPVAAATLVALVLAVDMLSRGPLRGTDLIPLLAALLGAPVVLGLWRVGGRRGDG